MANLLPAQKGSFRLFRLMGIEVYVHWLWFAAAFWELSSANPRYSSISWNVIEYLSMFLFVLLHEFGHALACRSVGGKADLIVLWLLGGVAYVSPPRRPGATLWCIAAGPLVNVVLMPVLIGLWFIGRALGWPANNPDMAHLVKNLAVINVLLLVFNLLPIYPLDGGKILQALLWFVVGEARSLMIASFIGMAGVALLFVFALMRSEDSTWWLLIAVFALSSCWRGLMRARMMGRLANAPSRAEFACPACHSSPPVGDFWRCSHCRRLCDTFARPGACPGCGKPIQASVCVRCGAPNSIDAWKNAANAAVDSQESTA